MVEKWTAADEKLFLELEQRRKKVEDFQHNTLYNAMFPAFDYESLEDTVNSMKHHAVAIHAALEPFVLVTKETSNEA